jgi:hypothetical protein
VAFAEREEAVTELLVCGLLILAGVVVGGAILLAWRYVTNPTDYFTWFILHFGVGALGILAAVILAAVHELHAAAASIISSLVAYSLGASSAKSGPITSNANTVKDTGARP